MKKITFTLMLFLFLAYNAKSQTQITTPECVVYDEVNNRYLVSCLNAGKVIAIDSNGNKSLFKSGFGYAFSATIYGNTYYISSSKYVKGFDLTTGNQVFNLYISPAHQLDGMTTDTNGFLYVTDAHYSGTGDQIFKINLQTSSYSVFANASSGIADMPQDLWYDKPNNRLLIVYAFTNSPIHAINLSDSTISTVLISTPGIIDGIEMDNNGNYYLTCWTTNSLIKYDHNFSVPPVTLLSGLNGPSNLGYDKVHNLLAVPVFNSDTVIFFPLSSIGIKKEETIYLQSTFELFQNYPNPFNPVTTIRFGVPGNGMNKSVPVSLRIFDINGKEISVLFKGILNSGVYSYTFNAQNLPSGVYIYRIETNGFSKSMRMTLIK